MKWLTKTASSGSTLFAHSAFFGPSGASVVKYLFLAAICVLFSGLLVVVELIDDRWKRDYALAVYIIKLRGISCSVLEKI